MQLKQSNENPQFQQISNKLEINKQFQLKYKVIVPQINFKKTLKKNYFQKSRSLKQLTIPQFGKPLVKQTVYKCNQSAFQAIGIIFMKIISYQFLQFGYSSLKLNMFKAINEFEREKIILRFQKLFNFTTSASEMITILSCSNKMIVQRIKQENISKNRNSKKINQPASNSILKIHQIVKSHFKEFGISLNFFTVFLRMILLLVKYPEEQLKGKQKTSYCFKKQMIFILCDYLGCKIEENSQYLLIQNIYFFKQNQQQIQFGIINKNYLKIKNNKYNQQNQQTKSTIDLHSKSSKLNCSIEYQLSKTIQSNKNIEWRIGSLKQKPKKFTFLGLEKCSSRLLLKNMQFTPEELCYYDQHKMKKNLQECNPYFAKNKIKQNQQKMKIWTQKIKLWNKNQRNSFYNQNQVQAQNIIQIETQNLCSPSQPRFSKSTQSWDFKCVKCSTYKQMKFQSNNFSISISNSKFQNE